MTWFRHEPSGQYFSAAQIAGIRVGRTEHNGYHAIIMLANGNPIRVLTGRASRVNLLNDVQTLIFDSIVNNVSYVILPE